MTAASDLARVRGTFAYAIDFALPGMLHAALVRSPHPHAEILAIDAATVLNEPGVVAVATGDDLAGLDPWQGVVVRDQPLLAIGKARYAGEPVAAVVARDPRSAARAAARVTVRWRLLPPVPTIEAALAPEAPALFDQGPPEHLQRGPGAESWREPARNILWRFRFCSGDVGSVFARADRVFTDTYRFPRMSHLPIEPLCAVARWDGSGGEVWCNNQDPFLLRTDLARIFALPEAAIRVHALPAGAGFGAKSYPKHEALALLLSRLARAPVRLALTWDEMMLTLSQHAAEVTLTTAVSADGVLLARRALLRLDGGAYADASVVVCEKGAYRSLPGPYRWQAVESIGEVVRTSTVPAGSFRGFGGPQACFAGERQLDAIARRLRLDPVEFRQRNLLRPGEAPWPGETPMDSDLEDGLSAVAERIGWRAPRAQGRGRGVAVGMKDGGGFSRRSLAVVKLARDGSALVLTGIADLGQGPERVAAAIVAEVLGIDPARVRLAPIDTDRTPHDQGTHASVGAAMVGLAIRRAAEAVRERLLALAAEVIDEAAGEIVLEAGMIRRGNVSLPIPALFDRAFGAQGSELIGEGEARNPFEAAAPLGSRCGFWMPSFAAAEVSVDVETGRVAVERLVVAGDAGHAIDPAGCRAQTEGGAVQGVAQALIEALAFDDEGRLANGAPLVYRMPSVLDLPREFETITLEHGLGPGPHGAKGLGEHAVLAVAAA
ncbi:MAG: xanthine dehydrogenase family protein molybdopterin-binding subunit, partial [Elioraea sp.]|nr:xanthine dehydrogenase family protein molybdopterin-binding subunit [Elioraea sp.]